MPELTVRSVSTRREKKQFLTLPWTLYRGDPNWIPPLRMDQKERAGYLPHPFYERNQIQTFLAYRGGEVCGRIGAILNHRHNEQFDARRGFFGFFECVDDQRVADALFDAVRRWFANQGIHQLRGPISPSLNYECGLLIDGFDSPPTFMMTYNPPYYARLIEDYGFAKTQDLYAFWGEIEMLPKISAKLAPIAEQIIERYDVKLRPMDKKNFAEDVEAFLDIFNRAMSNTWQFVPLSPAEVQHISKSLRLLMVPEMSILAEVDGRLVGASFAIPDYNPRVREIDGRLFPFGFVRLLRNKKAIKKIRLVSTNVIPEYQRMGIGLALMHGLMPMVIDWGIQEAEFSWVLESNKLSYGALKKGGAKIIKTYRLYDLDCTEDGDDSSGQGSSGRGSSGQGSSGRGSSGREKEQTAILTLPSNTAPSNTAPSNPAPSNIKSPLRVREVITPGDLDEFCHVPWPIYADDPQWVPPLLIEVKEFLNPRKHPFLQHGDATQFLAMRGREPVGRILVSDDPNYNRQHGANVGCFGMFESIDDREVAGGLLDAAAGWLKERGRDRIMGPVDYSTNNPCGLLIDGFDTPPRVMMNHNRIYYEALLESWGLTKIKDLYAWWFDAEKKLAEKWHRLVKRAEQRDNVVIRPIQFNDFKAEVARCQAVYHGAMRDHWGFVEMTDAEFQYLAKRLSQIIQPGMGLLAEVDGQPVGIAITLPDVNEAIRPLDGRLTRFGVPWNLLRLMRRIKKVKTARMIILDLLEDYRGRGIAERLILRTLETGTETIGYTTAELGWTLEDNRLINRSIERVGGRRYKTFRIYDKEID